MKLSRWIFMLAPAAVVCSCGGGQVVENVQSGIRDANVVDMAAMTYYLPKGIYEVTATYDDSTKTIKITRGDTATIVPDLVTKPQQVVYRHNEWFDDQASIEINQNGTLKEISTTSKDQTLAVAQAVTQIAQQFGAVKAAVVPPAAPPGRALAELLNVEPPACKPSEVRVTADLTNSNGHAVLDKNSEVYATATMGALATKAEEKSLIAAETYCKLALSLTVDQSSSSLAPPAYVSEDVGTSYDLCPASAVCFRVWGGFTVKIKATLEKETRIASVPQKRKTFKGFNIPPCAKGEAGCDVQVPIEASVDVALVAPVLTNPLGQVYINRRGFIENTTTVSFTNGMLTKIVSKNPSAVSTFISLPVEILKSFALLVKL